jgi:hypothetical protein
MSDGRYPLCHRQQREQLEPGEHDAQESGKHLRQPDILVSDGGTDGTKAARLCTRVVDEGRSSDRGARLVPAYCSEAVDIHRHHPLMDVLLLLTIRSQSLIPNNCVGNQRVRGSSP